MQAPVVASARTQPLCRAALEIYETVTERRLRRLEQKLYTARNDRRRGTWRFANVHVFGGRGRYPHLFWPTLYASSSLMRVFKLRLNRIRRPGSPDVHSDFVRTRATHDEIISVAP